jgi:DUF4097 and DUF4098 domain-containing protein YvlB
MIRTFLATAALAFLSQSAFADDWSKHWSVSGKPELHVSTGDASVTVEVGDDHVIDAKLTTVGWSIGPGGVHIEERQTGDKVQIEVRVPTTHFSWGNHSIHLEVRVPRDLIADLHTGDGSITMRGLHGDIRADTGDGSIRGEALDGALDAHTGDGSVHVAGRFDRLQLHTKDGSVEVEAKDGSRMNGDWHIQTGDGSVHMRLSKNLAANLEAHTGDGSIRVDLPSVTDRVKSEHSLESKLNGGGPALLLRTGDGSITVSAL